MTKYFVEYRQGDNPFEPLEVKIFHDTYLSALAEADKNIKKWIEEVGITEDHVPIDYRIVEAERE